MLASLAVVVGSMAVPAAGDAAECEADQCFGPIYTDSSGKGTFTFSPILVAVAEQQLGVKLRDCVWQVRARFDHGAQDELYTFSGATGLSASHTFPSPGEYRVDLVAEEGVHTEEEGPCPSFHFILEVVYPEPAPTPEPPGEAPPQGELPPGGSGTGPDATSGLDRGLPGAADAPASPGLGIERWRRCGGEVYTYRVACRKGRRVAAAALETLAGRRGSARVKGFNCRMRAAQGRLSCVRGKKRILGPLS